MRKLLFVFGILALLFFGMILMLPMLLDTSGFAERMRVRLQASGAYAMQHGAVDASMFPVPRIIIQGVTLETTGVENVKGTMKIQTIIGEFSWLSLFTGNAAVSTITLDNVTLDIAANGDGTDFGAVRKVFQPLFSDNYEAFSEVVRIENGKAVYRNSEKEIFKLGGVSLRINKGKHSLRTMLSNFTYNETPYELSVVPERKTQGEVFNITVKAPYGALQVTGEYNGNWKRIAGEAMLSLYTQDSTKKEVPVLTMKGPVHWDGERLFGQDITIKQGDTLGKAGFSLKVGDTSLASVEASFKHLTLDYLQSLGVFHQKLKEHDLMEWLFKQSLPKSVTMGFRVAVEKVRWDKYHFDVIQMQGEMRDGMVVVNQLVSGVPGEGQLVGFGVVRSGGETGLSVDGSVEVFGTDARAFLHVMGVEFPLISQDKLRSFRVKGGFLLQRHQVQLREVELSFDDMLINGALIADTSDSESEPKIRLLAQVSNLDIDGYFGAYLIENVSEVGGLDADQSFKRLNFSWLQHVVGNWRATININSGFLAGHQMRNVQSLLNMKKNKAVFEEVSALIDHSNVKGEFTIENRENHPFVKAKLAVSDLETSNLTLLKRPDPTETDSLGDIHNWSKEQLDVDFLRLVDAVLDVKVGRWKHKELDVKKVIFIANIKEDTLNVKEFSGETFDGVFSTSGYLAGGSVPLLSFGVTAEELSIDKTLTYFLQSSTASGVVNIEAKLSSSGLSPYTILQHMEGEVSFIGRDIIVDGMDIPYIGQGLASISTVSDIVNLAWRAMSEGSSEFSYAAAGWLIENGVAETSNGQVVFDNGNGILRGKINLLEWLVDMNLVLQFTAFDDETAALPTLGIRVKDKFWEPQLELDTQSVESYISRRAAEELIDKNTW